MANDGAAGAPETVRDDRLESILAETRAELDELRVANYRLELENLRLRVSLELLHENAPSDESLDRLIALRERESDAITLEP